MEQGVLTYLVPETDLRLAAYKASTLVQLLSLQLYFLFSQSTHVAWLVAQNQEETYFCINFSLSLLHQEPGPQTRKLNTVVP